MHSAFGAIGRFSVRFRWPLLILWIAAAIAAVHFLPSLSSVTQNSNTNFLPASAPSQHAADLATPLQPTNVTSIPVVVARSGQLTAADENAIAQLRRNLAAEPSVTSVKDIGRSADGQAEQVQVLADMATKGGGQQQQADETLVANLRSAISKTSLPGGLQPHLAGQIAANVDNSKQSGNSSNSTQDLSILLIVVVLAFVFRAVLAPLVTLLPAVVVVAMAGPLVAEAGKHGVNVSALAQVLLIVLVLGAGTDYGLFLVFRVREELRGGRTPKEAVVKAVERVGESITFSAGTVIAALLSLLAASFGMYSNLGIPLAIGIVLMLFAGLTLLPAILAILGRAVFWPSRVRPGTQKTGLWGRISGNIVQRPVVTLCAGLVFFGGLAAAATGYVSAGFGGTTNPPSGSDSAQGQALLTQHFPRTAANPTQIIFQLPKAAWDDPSVLATAQRKLQSAAEFKTVTGPLSPNGLSLTPSQYTELHAALGPAQNLSPTPSSLSAPVGAAPGSSAPAATRTKVATSTNGAGAHAAAGGNSAALVDGKFTVAEYEAYRATAQYVSPDGKTVQFSAALTAGDPSTTAAMNAVPSIRAEVSSVATEIGATDKGVVGMAPGLYDISDISNNDMASVIPIAIAVIGLLLILVMRSLVAPLYLIVSVALSYFAALGLAVLLFVKIGHSDGLVFVLPFLMFIFLLALGEDYNILVMTRIREEAHHLSLREAVRRALNATGTTVTSAGVVLAGTFAVLAIQGGANSNSQMRDIGTGLALGILMDTFLVRTLLVPSAVLLLGKWNWWPSKLTHRHAAAETVRAATEVPALTVVDDPGSPQAAEATTPVMSPGAGQNRAVTNGHGPLPSASRPAALLDSHTSGVAAANNLTVSGHVSAPDGSPMNGAALTIIDQRGRQVGRTASGGDGHYRIDVPASGSYLLIASGLGHQPQATTVTVGRDPQRVDLSLARSAELIGTIRLAGNDTPVVGATVTLTTMHGEVAGTARTDSHGDYAFSGLDSGAFTMVVSAHLIRPVATVLTVPPSGSTRQDIAVTRSGLLAGIASTPTGRAISDAHITIVDADGAVAAMARTDSSGHYTIPDLAEGSYTVMAAGYPPTSSQVSIRASKETVHDIHLSHEHALKGSTLEILKPR